MIARRNDAQVALRLPNGLRDRVQALARRNGRSTNTEIVMILDRVIKGAEAATGAEFGDDTPAAVDPNTAVDAAGQFQAQQKDC